MNNMGYDLVPESKDKDIEQVTDIYLTHKGCFLVAVDKDKIIGSIGIRALDNNQAELKRFYVIKTYQSQGIGRELIHAAIEHAHKMKFDSLKLDTSSKSKKAIQIFEKIGFKEIPKYNDDPYAELYMELKLNR